VRVKNSSIVEMQQLMLAATLDTLDTRASIERTAQV
jgi:hypothetical protein